MTQIIPKAQVDTVLDNYADCFTSVPPVIAHAMIKAETSYDVNQFYRQEPDYYNQYMFRDRDFWGALLGIIYPGEEVNSTNLTKRFAASYGIIQVMYDIALDISVREDYYDSSDGKGGSLRRFIDEWRAGEINLPVAMENLIWPEELNDIENGVYYGLSEFTDKVRRLYEKIMKTFYKGFVPAPTYEEFVSGTSTPITFGNANFRPFEFFKFAVSSYQAGTGTVIKLLSFARAENIPFEWERVKQYVPRIRNEKNTRYIWNHIARAFEGLKEEDLTTWQNSLQL